MDLKQFIHENSAAFNSEEPGSHVFKKIQEQLPGTTVKKKPVWQQFRWAAMVAGILLVSAAFFFFSGKNKKPVTAEEPATYAQEINEIGDPQYAKQIYHFKELIGLKQNELKQLEKEYPELYRQFLGDIQQLDSSYQSLKINLAKNPNREMLLEAMIQNLQLQSDLLNRQLLIIKEIKQKSITNEKSTI
ncbi:MAG TPA: hypothetical protein VGO58_10915 [Chitinophagaceae bacterium]|jgi:hypothetical protein|nr:hypothetical protein [Chitinophagaceae bacterium]